MATQKAIICKIYIQGQNRTGKKFWPCYGMFDESPVCGQYSYISNYSILHFFNPFHVSTDLIHVDTFLLDVVTETREEAKYLSRKSMHT